MRQVESGLLSPVVGYLVDRVGPRKVILVGVIIVGTGMVLISFASNIWLFYVAFIYASIGMSGASHGITWAVVVARWFRRKRGRATSLAMMGGALGGPSVILISLLEAEVGWRAAVFWLGLGVLVIGIPLSLVARARPTGLRLPARRRRAAGYRRQAVDCTRADCGSSSSTLRFHGEAGLAQQSVLGACRCSGSAASQHGRLAGASDSLLSGYRVQRDTGRFHRSGCLQRERHRQDIRRSAYGHLRLAACPCRDHVWTVHIALLILANVTVYWQALVFAVVLGLFHGMSVPSRPIIAGTIFGTRAFGTIWGVVDGAIVTIGLAGPLFLGWTFDTFDSYVPAFYVMMTILAVTIPVIFIVFRTPRPAQAPGA